MLKTIKKLVDENSSEDLLNLTSMGRFNCCCNIINTQKDVDVHHEIISGLPEHEAHIKLWQTWNRAKSKHDLFVKIDADTVLNDAHSLAR